MIEVTVRENGGVKRILFSGDLGRFPQLILREPVVPEDGFDYLLLESTYGDRLHPRDDVGARLASIVEGTAQRGGTVLIPSFAVGRTQELLYLFRELIERAENAFSSHPRGQPHGNRCDRPLPAPPGGP